MTIKLKLQSLKKYQTYVLTFVIILFTNDFKIFGQINGKIDGNFFESGVFIKNISLNYYPKNKDTDIYSLNLENFQFGFSDMKLKSWKDTSDFYSKLEFKGPQIHLKNLALQANLFKPDWITEEKLKGIYRRESLPKKAIGKLNNAIELYHTDQKAFPRNTNDLIINNYIDISKKPFDNASWVYTLDLPNTIIAEPSHNNPIPKNKLIVFNFGSKEFKKDPLIDSLKSVPFLKWLYNFEMKSITVTSSTNLDIKLNNSNSNFSIIMEHGQFKIDHVSFIANPENQLKNKSTISLPELLIESNNLIIDGQYDSSFTFHQGEGQFKIRNFEIKIPEDLGKEPDIENFLSQIGVWNNSVTLRLIDLKIKMMNQFTGNISLKFHTPFIKAFIKGNLSFRQEDNSMPRITFHNTEASIHPIALGLKKWIRNWEKKEGKTLKRKGPSIIIKFNGPINSLNSQALKDITIF